MAGVGGNVDVFSPAVLTIDTGVVNAIADTGTLTLAGSGADNIANGGHLVLTGGISETVGGLVLGGVVQTLPGTYGSSLSSATFVNNEFFSGTGVVVLVPEPSAFLSVVGGLGTLVALRRFRRA